MMLRKIGLLLILVSAPLLALENSDCLMCHQENPKFKTSVHGGLNCASCHPGADTTEMPHNPDLAPVDCGGCHTKEQSEYTESLHGKAFARKEKFAPSCKDCHGSHDIMPQSLIESKSYRINIPGMCGRCHHDSSDVEKIYNTDEKDALHNYAESIHGKGLFERGLIVTAVCSNCHTSHSVLPHEDKRSSINRNNIAKTCAKCHGQIAAVHQKIIYGKKWQESPDVLPVCTDCHFPHKIRRVIYNQMFEDENCLNCHQDQDIHKTVTNQKTSLYVDKNFLEQSIHNTLPCVKCHINVTVARKPVCKDSGKVDCSICHADQSAEYQKSIHGALFDRGDSVAPTCLDCHGTSELHLIKSRRDPASVTFVRNVPSLCGRCHQEEGQAAKRHHGTEREIITNYSMSIHGKALFKSGLLVTAVCNDCHTAHLELPAEDPGSSVHKDNIALTCSKCHEGIYSEFKNSVHFIKLKETNKELPTCNDCHSSHQIDRADDSEFRQVIITQCGRCHADVTNTYFDTYHGKISKLGFSKTARCADCHGAHNILPITDPRSTVSFNNIIDTCKKCHPHTTRQFTGYLTHATHHNRHKYPILFYSFWAMTLLLVGTFLFFGMHTLLWLPRSFKELKLKRKHEAEHKDEKLYRRIDPLHRTLHFIVIVSFFGLTITGMTLKFSYMSWAASISHIFGGFEIMGFIHRVCAILTFFYFAVHIAWLVNKYKKDKRNILDILFSQESMIPLPRDVIQFFQTMKWFIGKGPKPEYGRWTYWEKFDYFAVFWGVNIIGVTGLFLWFPNLFTQILPGWVLNVATIIHSDEALLASGFIFTIHFFNTHFRPEKFPMDPVIFTGRITLSELQNERPAEYRELVETGRLSSLEVSRLPRWFEVAAKIFGLLALFTGMFMTVLIIISMLMGYK